MNCENITISDASSDDLTDVLALLTDVQLPHDGVVDHISRFFIARDESSRIVATIGLERHGNIALLRSAAVAPQYQHCGLGSRLTTHLLEQATNEGIERVVLLTTTAKDFFERRFGFCETSRASYETDLADSTEWNLPRCSTAVCMSLDLKHKH